MAISKKHLLFSIITLLAPLIILGLVEIVLYGIDRNNDTFEFPVSIFSQSTVDGKPFYKVTHPQAYRGRNLSFPAKKETGTLRIFCLGESASAGWPHPPAEIYSEYLRAALQKAFPDRPIEVLNVSGHGFPSYRVRRVYDDVVKFDPDFIVIYTGNNEFLEIRGHGLHDSLQERLNAIRAHLRWLRSFRYLEHLVIRAANEASSLGATRSQKKNPAILSKIRRQVIDLRKDPRLYNEILGLYHHNIEYMASDAARRGIPVLLLTVPVNLSDWLPNVSYNRLSGQAFERWETYYRLGQKSTLQKNYREAVEYLQKGLQLEPLHGETYFHLARAYAHLGQIQSSLENYRKARDLDYNPFRAIGAFNDSIRRIAATYGNVSLVDLEKIFIENSAQGTGPGFDLFLDYVHPTKKGNLLIAKAVLNQILKRQLPGVHLTAITGGPHSVSASLGGSTTYDERKDIHLQGAMLYVSAVMHQYERVVEIARSIEDNLAQMDMADSSLEKYVSIEAPAGGTLSEKAGDLYGKHRRAADLALKVFPGYLELARDEVLGVSVDPKERTEILNRYRNYYDLMESGVWPVTENQ